MTSYEATVTADLSGYTNSVQQALALTKEYAAANEGLAGAIGKVGTKGIMAFNDAMGITGKLMKANTAEAANYAQVMGKVSSQATAAGQKAVEVQKATKQIARDLTGSIGSAVELVNAVQKQGFVEPKAIKEMSKTMVNLGAATGEAGDQITSSLLQVQRAYGKMPDGKSVADLGDSLTTVSAKFGASAAGVADFSKEIAPFAKQVGLSQTAVIGFSTAFARMGQEGFRSANVFSKVLSDIDKAVRDGLPTLGVYASQMGKTYDETMKLAKANPNQFVLEFIQSLGSEGDKSIRTLEALGLEGVRSQKSIAALTAGGDLQNVVETAAKEYGSGSAATAAAESLQGINEQALKMQESLKQVVSNSGAPMLGFLEQLTGASTKSASALASLTGSSGFQAIFGILGGTLLAGGMAAKGVGALYGLGSLGAGYSALNQMGREPGMLSRAGSALMPYRGRIAMGGMAGMAIGSMTDSPSMNMLGMGAILGSSLIGGGGFRKAQDAWRFLTSDTIQALQTDPRKWGKDMGTTARVLQQAGMGGMTPAQYAAMNAAAIAPGALREPTGFGSRARMQDQIKFTENHLKDLVRSGKIGEQYLDEFNKTTRLVGAGGKGLYLQSGISGVANMALTRQSPGQIRQAIDDLKAASITKEAMAAQTSLNKLRYTAGGMAAGLGQIAMTPIGMTKAMAPALFNPYVLGGAAVVGGLAYGGVKLNQARTNRDLLGDVNVPGVDKINETYGLVPGAFRSVTVASNELARSFEGLTNSIQTRVNRGGDVGNVTMTELASLDREGEPSTDLRYQNFMVRNWQVRGQRNSDQSNAELLAKYGTTGDPRNVAAMLTDLAKLGKTDEELIYALHNSQKYMGTNTEALELVGKEWADQRNKPFSENLFGDLLQRWVADRPEMSGSTAAASVIDMVKETSKTENLNRAETQRFLNESLKAVQYRGPEVPELAKAQVPEGASDEVRNWMEREYNRVSRGDSIEAFYGKEGRPARPEGATDVKTTDQILDEFKKKVVGIDFTPFEEEIQSWKIGTGTQMGKDLLRAANREAVATTPGRTMPQGPGLPGNQPATEAEAIADKTAMAFGKAAVAYMDNYKAGDVGSNLAASNIMAQTLLKSTQGDMSAALREARSQRREFSVGTTEYERTNSVVVALEKQQGMQRQGMDQWSSLQKQYGDTVAELGAIADEMATGKARPGLQEDLGAALGDIDTLQSSMIDFAQNFLKATREFERTKQYAEEDYTTSVRYANEDYTTQRAQATEQFQRQQQYAQEDHLRQMRYAEEDYQKTLARAEREYNKQRLYAYEDFAKAMERRTEDMAKGMMDPFSRMAVESTWSGSGLLANMAEQQRAIEKQVKNLEALRSAGVDQGAIDILGLNDPSKAQQLDRFLRDINTGGSDMVDQVNQMASEREGLAGQLFSGENDINTRRMEEDYQTGLDRMADSRRTWLSDSETDYRQSVDRAEETFNESMERAQTQFDTSMQYMADAHNRALTRMAEQHKTSMDRINQQFHDTWEGMTADLPTLMAQMGVVLDGGMADWSKILTGGWDKMAADMKGGEGKAFNTITESILASAQKFWANDSAMMEAANALANLIGAAGAANGPTGGGPGPAGMPGPLSYGGESGAASYLVSEQGDENKNNPYGKPNSRYAAGYHTGMDIGAPQGTPIRSAKGGVVKLSGAISGYGNAVQVDIGGGVQLLYGHMVRTGVGTNTLVGRGTILGYVGHTGNADGNHLHFEARSKVSPHHPEKYPGYGSDVDPRQYLWQGGIVQSSTDARIGENVYPEAVIPLNQRGIDVLGQALERAFGSAPAGMTKGGDTYISYVTNEDHSVNVMGPVEVVSTDPEQVGRELERKARAKAIITPGSR